MRDTITKITCDICKKDIDTNKENSYQNIRYPVLFCTEETEGKGVTPHIRYKKLDICKDCVKKVIKITGAGAQGYNFYELIPDWKEWSKQYGKNDREIKLEGDVKNGQ